MKGKKLLAGVLSAAMVLGTMAFPAFAEENPGTDSVEEFMSLKAQSVNDTHEIDLNGAIVNVDGEYWSNIYADITIKNGTINFSDFTTPDGIFRIGYWSCDHPVTLTLEDMTINVTNVTASTGVFTMQNQDDTLVLNNSTINATGITDTPGIFYTPNGVDSVRGSVEITGGRLSVETDSALFFNNDVDLNGTTISCTVDRPVFRQSAGSVENTTITVNDVIDGATRGIVEDIAGNPDGTVEFKNSNVKAPEGQTLVKINTSGKVLAVADADSTYTTVDDSENETSTLMTSVADVKDVGDIVASIGSAKYLTFADALAAAQDGNVIDLLGNTVQVLNETHFLKSVTVKNGTIDITGANIPGDCIFGIGDYSTTDVTVTFDNINFKGDGYDSAAGVFYPYDGNTLKITNSTFDLKGEQGGFGLIYANPSTEMDGTPRDGGKVYIENVTGTLDNTKRFVWFGDTEIKNATLTLKNFRGDAAIFEAAPVTVTGDSEIVVENSDTIFTDNSAAWARNIALVVSYNSKLAGDGNIVINNNSTINVDDTSVIDANITYVNVAANITDEITVDLVPTDNESVYDIVLDGNYKEICEFVSAEIQFVNAGNGYEIDGTDDINVSPTTDKSDRYGFYLKDGAVGNRITATKIKIGTVTFPEQGAISFKVDANNSKVVATKYKTHHEKYYTAADANAKLTADENGINSTIAAKTRNVAINVDFAHTPDNSYIKGRFRKHCRRHSISACNCEQCRNIYFCKCSYRSHHCNS